GDQMRVESAQRGAGAAGLRGRLQGSFSGGVYLQGDEDRRASPDPGRSDRWIYPLVELHLRAEEQFRLGDIPDDGGLGCVSMPGAGKGRAAADQHVSGE